MAVQRALVVQRDAFFQRLDTFLELVYPGKATERQQLKEP